MIKNQIKIGFLYCVFLSVMLFATFVVMLVRMPLFTVMDFSGWLYFLPAAFSQAVIFALLPFVLSLPFLFIARGCLYSKAMVLLSTILLLFFIVDAMIYSLYRFHINGFVIDMLFGGAAGDIFQFDLMLYLKIGAALVFLVVLMSLVWMLCKFTFNKKGYVAAWPISVTFIVILLFAHLFHAYAAVVKIPTVIRSAAIIPYNMPLTANRLMVKLGVVSKETMTRNFGGGSVSGIKYPINPLVVNADSVQKNIVLILVDSWNVRAWREDVTPNLWNFSKECTNYENHLSSSNGTTGSVIGMFYGLPSRYKKDLDVSGIQPLLVEQMLSNGYDVKPFASASLVHPPFGRMLFSDISNLRIESKGATVYDRDCEITAEFIDYINEEPKQPFFAFLFYDLAHGCQMPAERNKPFEPAWDYVDYLALNNDTDPTPYWNLYLNSLHNIDSLAGCVLDELKAKDMLRNTVVIITGDHGQEFNENKKNYWGHNSNFSPVQLRVPFCIYDADKEVKKYRHRTTHYDFSATLMKEYLGVKNPVEDLGIGFMMDDDRNRDWHIVGDDINYAFIMDKEMNILENNYAGYIEVWDSLMTPMYNYKYDVEKLNSKVLELTRFYE